MRRHLLEVAAIARQTSVPTFEDTIAALERSGELLTRVLKVFGVVTAANTNPTLQRVQAEEAPQLAAHSDAIFLNDRLYERVQYVFANRDRLDLSSEQRAVVERYRLDFLRSGAELDGPGKMRLRALNQEEASLAAEFQSRLLAASKANALVVTDLADLEGLSQAEVAAASAAGRERGLDETGVIPLHNTTQQPALASLRRRATRHRLYDAAIHRADRGDSADTRGVAHRLAQIRAERAALLGYETSADFVLQDQMAKNPRAATGLLTEIGVRAAAMARAEASRLQAIVDGKGTGFHLEPWDWQYYAERVRKVDYDLDEAEIKPYFELDRVLRHGVFRAATLLYGITFAERTDIPVYHPDVRVFEVFDGDGSALALFYGDYFKRDNKDGGAWMDSFVDQAEALRSRAVVVNVANFAKPAPNEPALLSFDDVTTMFHEFGHALHGMLARVQYPLLTGTNVPRDFAEFPSQLNEHWALDPVVVPHYAVHHETGMPMPQALLDRIRRAQTFNQGFALTEYITAALIDMAWHTLRSDDHIPDVHAFERAALERHRLRVPEVPPRYHTTYFAHIWSGGYEAGYYAYLWAEVLDHDAHAWFLEHGGLTRENGRRFRDMILARGGTEDAAMLYRAFRGRDPIVEPLLRHRGLDPGADHGARELGSAL